MKYYAIENKAILIADNQTALSQYYDYVQELPEDYVEGKYIIGEKEIEIDVPDYDEEGNPIIIEYEDTEIVIDYDEEGNPIGQHEITVKKHKQQTHKETITIKTLVLNPNWEEEQAEKEKERIAKLSLTKREVFLALYHAKQITPDMIKAQIGENTEALIEFEYAEKYYRFNPLIDTIGGMLGYTSADLDYLFIHKELPVKEEAQD